MEDLRFKKLLISKILLLKILNQQAKVAQLVELQPSKLEVAGSRPVFRSVSFWTMMLSKGEVTKTKSEVEKYAWKRKKRRQNEKELDDSVLLVLKVPNWGTFGMWSSMFF